MNSKGLLILKLFIQHFHPDNPEMLIKHLSKEQAEEVTNQKLSTTDLTPLLNLPQTIIGRLHPTWLELPLKKLSLSMDSFNEAAGSQPFIINNLFNNIGELPELPLEYLPESDLSPLAKLKGKALSQICDYLGLYDLAAELRYIVDKVSIQNLYSCLTPQETSYLKGCLQKKERITVPKLGIDPRKKEPEKWREIIHKRGLLRLEKALAGQNRNLVWYISRAIEKEEGISLYQSFTANPIPEVTAILKTQTMQVANFLKKIGAL